MGEDVHPAVFLIRSMLTPALKAAEVDAWRTLEAEKNDVSTPLICNIFESIDLLSVKSLHDWFFMC